MSEKPKKVKLNAHQSFRLALSKFKSALFLSDEVVEKLGLIYESVMPADNTRYYYSEEIFNVDVCMNPADRIKIFTVFGESVHLEKTMANLRFSENGAIKLGESWVFVPFWGAKGVPVSAVSSEMIELSASKDYKAFFKKLKFNHQEDNRWHWSSLNDNFSHESACGLRNDEINFAKKLSPDSASEEAAIEVCRERYYNRYGKYDGIDVPDISAAFAGDKIFQKTIEILGYTELEPAPPRVDLAGAVKIISGLHRELLESDAAWSRSNLDVSPVGVVTHVWRHHKDSSRLALVRWNSSVSLIECAETSQSWEHIDVGRPVIMTAASVNSTVYRVVSVTDMTPLVINDQNLRTVTANTPVATWKDVYSHYASSAKISSEKLSEVDYASELEEMSSKKTKYSKPKVWNKKYCGINFADYFSVALRETDGALKSIEFQNFTLTSRGYKIAGMELELDPVSAKSFTSYIQHSLTYSLKDFFNHQMNRIQENIQLKLRNAWVSEPNSTLTINGSVSLSKVKTDKSGYKLNGKRICVEDFERLLSDCCCLVGRGGSQEEVDAYITEVSRIGYPVRDALIEGIPVNLELYNLKQSDGPGHVLFKFTRSGNKNFLKISDTDMKQVRDLRGLARELLGRTSWGQSKVELCSAICKAVPDLDMQGYLTLFQDAAKDYIESFARSKKLFDEVCSKFSVTQKDGYAYVTGTTGHQYRVNISDGNVYYLRSGRANDWSRICIVDGTSPRGVGMDSIVAKILSVANDGQMKDVIHTLPSAPRISADSEDERVAVEETDDNETFEETLDLSEEPAVQAA